VIRLPDAAFGVPGRCLPLSLPKQCLAASPWMVSPVLGAFSVTMTFLAATATYRHQDAALASASTLSAPDHLINTDSGTKVGTQWLEYA